jgi:hypothetical protein
MEPTPKQLSSGKYKLIGGVWHKICTGQAHDEPTYLPATEKYFYFLKIGPRRGRPVARCRLCHNWAKLKSPGSHHGLVPVDKVHPFYAEAVNRVGMMELHRRSGLSIGHLSQVLTKRIKHVKKEQARRLMLELVSIQRKNEYSINRSSRWRTERRNNRGHDTCSQCGTPKVNYTKGCATCRNRLYDAHRKGGMPTEEYERLRREMLDDGSSSNQ